MSTLSDEVKNRNLMHCEYRHVKTTTQQQRKKLKQSCQNSVWIPGTWRINQPAVAASFYLQKQSQVAMGTFLYGWLTQTICSQENHYTKGLLSNTHHLQNSRSFQSDNIFTVYSFNEMLNLHSFNNTWTVQHITLSRLTFIHNSLEHDLLS